MGRFVAPRPFLARIRRRSAARVSTLARVAGPAVTAAAMLGLAAPTASAQRLLPVGSETHVNTFTAGDQALHAIATAADGAYVVVWSSTTQDAGTTGVYGQRYNAAGVAQGTEFRVNSYTTGGQTLPAVAMNATGDFVVTWRSDAAQDGSSNSVHAQRYNAQGVAQGVEFQVNTYTTDAQGNPSVAMAADGRFVIAWDSYAQDGQFEGIYAQRYSAAGAPAGGEFHVSTATTHVQSIPAVAMGADGAFIVVWKGAYDLAQPQLLQYDIYGQRYSADGVAQGGEFKVNAYSTNMQNDPSVGVAADGDYVVAWYGEGVGDTIGIYARRLTAAGVGQGGDFRVNTFTTNSQILPSVGVQADGSFVVAWQSNTQDGDNYGVYAQPFSAEGVAQGAEIKVSTYTTAIQNNAAVAVDADGDAVVAWQSQNQEGAGTGFGIYQQRYAVQAVTAAARGAEGWRMLAAPSATATLTDLLGPVWTQGFPGADYAGGGSNVYRYDESATGALAVGYTAPASAAAPMGSGRGYLAYLYSDDDFNTAGVQGGFPKFLYVLYSAGDAPVGPVALPVTYTPTADGDEVDGWNLVGNPYRQSIDWDLAAREDVASSAYVYDPALPGYRVWNGAAGNLADGVVAPLQGFWVKAMDTDVSGGVTPSASVPATAQVTGGTFYGRGGEGTAAGVLALRLTRGDGGYGRTAEAFVSFEAGAAAGLDAADAYLLDPAALDYTALFTRAADGTALAIQALAEGGTHTLGLEVAAFEGGTPAGGAFTLAWDAPALGAGTTARLLDAVTGTSVDLAAAGTYTFTLDAPAGRTEAPASAGLTPPAPRALGGDGQSLTAGRFSIVVNGAVTGTETGAAALALTVAPNPLTGAGLVRYVLPEAGHVRIAMYDVLGREVAVLADMEQGAGRYSVALQAGALAPGAYVVRLTAGETRLVRRVTVAR